MLQRIAHENGVVTYQSPRLRDLGVIHAFTTRLGGVSRGPYAALNLGPLSKDDASDFNTSIAENYRRLRRALAVEKFPRVEVKQVHGCAAWIPPRDHLVKPADAPCADAIVTDQAGMLLTIRVADCVPVLLASEDGKHVAAVHAGWRGVVMGVTPRAVGTFREDFGIRPAQLVAAVGPCIGVEAFEVDADVAEAFDAFGLDDAIVSPGDAKPHIDLRQAVVLQLHRAGVPPEAIDVSERCTYRDEAEFFSHRRDVTHRRLPGTGRLAAVIAAKPA
jgi:YfiH family protein